MTNSNFELARKHELRVSELVGRANIIRAGTRLDWFHATDMLMFNISNGRRVATRVRTHKNRCASQWEFTIRTRARGGRTEYHKFMDGECDLMFYGNLNEAGSDFDDWMLFDVRAWRRARQKVKDTTGWEMGIDCGNRDGTGFRVYNATHPAIIEQHDFMIDCHDFTKYPGTVASRHSERSDPDARRRMAA